MCLAPHPMAGFFVPTLSSSSAIFGEKKKEIRLKRKASTFIDATGMALPDIFLLSSIDPLLQSHYGMTEGRILSSLIELLQKNFRSNR